jgi:hypothetical protein
VEASDVIGFEVEVDGGPADLRRADDRLVVRMLVGNEH